MKKILLILISIISFSCSNETKPKEIFTKDIVDKKVKVDSTLLKDPLYDLKINKGILDSTGMNDCPILVTKAEMVDIEYSNKKNVRLNFKNISNKKVLGIKFEWFGLNIFNEPADMGSSLLNKGEGGGFTEEVILPNKTSSGTWDVFSSNGKKIIMARAYEVVFENGEIWKLRP